MATGAASGDGTTNGAYRLIVAVGDPSYSTQLVRTAVDIARAQGGEVMVITVVHKPHDSPFSVFSDEAIRTEFAGDRREILENALAVADDTVPVDGRVVVGTDVARAIRSAVAELGADALLVGWHGRPRRGGIVLGSTIDDLLRRIDCDVLVERIGPTADGVERVLLPVAGGPHLSLAASVAEAIAGANDATVVVLSVVAPSADEAERETARGHIEEATDLLSVPIETELLEASGVEDAVVEAAAECDLVVFGATRRGVVRRRLVGSVPQAVGRRSNRTVIVARRRLDRSLFGRLAGRLWDR
ncbi:universal stress protein [Halalkalicoccus jeotgali]|uniref:Amino acid transporter n=1 Tax=Halalkalicoccus jeotgali (strain DSM 18796 / CECT 7217 / JCM 14584 / KCTC 4019 / B3) TaxID=795797 RepID=D8J5T9_HALJB|nr:universal stress protein [Halalkalicoccus jeotgali]ADJ13745.1 amino acid transporter [Halalkalicoccus jeotgali B3]ELY34209.1 amino acid transporter [Halalkalicoccus jeotgali B3]